MPSASERPVLFIQQIKDQYIRKNFENLADYYRDQNQFLDFKFFEKVFTQAQTGVKLVHGLPYIPLDILVSRITGTGTVTFQYSQFDSTHIILDVSGPCRVRFFAGTYNQSANAATSAGDVQSVTAQASGVAKTIYTDSSAPLSSSLLSSGSYPGSSSSTYGVRANSDDVILVDCTTGAQAVTLPLASSVKGRTFTVMKTDASFTKAVTISAYPGSSDTFAFGTSTTLNTQGESVVLFSTGSSWQILSRTIPQVWTAYTPTGSWIANTVYTGFWARRGESIRIRAMAKCSGAPTAASFTLSIPSGLTIDPSAFTLAVLTDVCLNGVALAVDNGVAVYDARIAYATSNTVFVRYSTTAAGVLGDINATNPFVFGANDEVIVEFEVPITGWKG